MFLQFDLMFIWIKSYWHFSRLRFYIKNAIWNYNFWLKSKKIFETIEYKVKDQNGFYTGETKRIKKFKGFLFKEKIYLDNPGFPIENRELWTTWKNKGLIK